MSLATKLLGQFIPYGSNDPAVLASYACTSSDEIGTATITGTETYDPVMGVKIAAATNARLTFAALVPTLTDLDDGCTIQFEAESEPWYAIAGSSLNYFMTWGGGKFCYAQGVADPGAPRQDPGPRGGSQRPRG